ncbi:MAG: hypothetical protein HYV41_00980 [Candidatus Magasanikbacteria bacterium]|nr:hypothetical protein [Candidatus Magasanikbacteria bacterium]
MHYLFILGHQPHISVAELKAIFSQYNISYITEKQTPEHLLIETSKKLDTQELIDKLGGTIQIGEYILSTLSPKETIIHELGKCDGKIHFSISGNNAKRLALEIKKELKKDGKSVRYVEAKNTATILHNNLVDKKSHFIISGTDVFVTTAIQDIEDFSRRDYDRPGSDSTSGMLPPKLARIMINLAQADTSATLLDPFCGSGTILTEALSLGYTKLIGSDLSTKAISDTRQNIEWMLTGNPPLGGRTMEQLSSRAHFDFDELPFGSEPLRVEDSRIVVTQRNQVEGWDNIQLIESDATNLSKYINPNSVTAIISEPYMGKPLRGNETKTQLHTQANELAKLYIKSFEQFHKILKKNGHAIFVIPKFKFNKEWISINCLDQIKKIGFELVPFDSTHESLLYHRPKQFVGREIWKFKKI